MIAVLPDADEDFEEDQTPRIIFGYVEHLIEDLLIDEDKNGGSFKAIGLAAFKDDPMNPWILLPDGREIKITHQSGTSCSECLFEYLS